MWLILFLRTHVYKGFIYEYQFACFVCACVDVRLCVKSEWSSYSLINSNLIKSQLGLSFMMLVAAKTLLKHVPNNQFIILFILRHKNNLFFFSLSLSHFFCTAVCLQFQFTYGTHCLRKEIGYRDSTAWNKISNGKVNQCFWTREHKKPWFLSKVYISLYIFS